jgi:hypothetical protein
MTKDEALNLAQKELIFYRDFANCQDWRDESQVVITAIKEILSQPEQERWEFPFIPWSKEEEMRKSWAASQPAQEPVAWLEPECGEKICPEVGYEITMTYDHPRDLCWIPLYPHPPQPPQRTWVGLTDEELDKLHGSPLSQEHSSLLLFVRDVEAQLRSKNT